MHCYFFTAGTKIIKYSLNSFNILNLLFLFFVKKGAKTITTFEILPEPPVKRADDNPWPQFPRVFKVDYGHEEVRLKFGRDPRQFSTLSKVICKKKK